jgi:hypothetical protein
MRNAYRILVTNPERRDNSEDLRVDGIYDIKMDLRERGLEGVNWIHLAQEKNRWRAVAITIMNLQVPCKAGNFLTS